MTDIRRNIPIGQVLLDNGNITEEQLAYALAYKEQHPSERLGDVLEHLNFISEREKLLALGKRLSLTLYEGAVITPHDNAAENINESIARKYGVMPMGIKENSLLLATDDPLNFSGLDEISTVSGFPVEPVLAPRSVIQESISLYYSQSNISSALTDLQSDAYRFADRRTERLNVAYIDEFNEITEAIDNAPLVKFINNVIRQAYGMGASDIHFEPFSSEIIIRFRVDGLLMDYMHLDNEQKLPLITRLKIMGDLNIAESRIPQDGRIDITIDQKPIDIRISSIPTIYGEKIVIRLLGNSTQELTKLEDLGLSGEDLSYIRMFLRKPYGIILLTGPTGSGKTTTLYAMLQELMDVSVNIITVEDPVEKRIDGINQVQVNTKAGLTFANGLRSILRQDPDIIMLGEIRDEETAEIAIRSAITGHLVLSTIHTNDTPTAIARLADMGVAPYLIASGVCGIMAQRLVRRLCENCKEEMSEEEKIVKRLSGQPGKIYKAVGCPHCNNIGYKGRIAVFEIMPINAEIRSMISSNKPIDEIRDYALEHGMRKLSSSASHLVQEGKTTIEELERVISE